MISEVTSLQEECKAVHQTRPVDFYCLLHILNIQDAVIDDVMVFNNNNNNNQDDIYGAVIMAHCCESSPCSFDVCRLGARWPPTHRLNQQTWAESPPVGCYHPHPPSPFIITQPKS